VATVVADQPLAVIAAIELDGKPSCAVEEVSPGDEATPRVVQVRLHLWSRKPCGYQKPAQARLHW